MWIGRDSLSFVNKSSFTYSVPNTVLLPSQGATATGGCAIVSWDGKVAAKIVHNFSNFFARASPQLTKKARDLYFLCVHLCVATG